MTRGPRHRRKRAVSAASSGWPLGLSAALLIGCASSRASNSRDPSSARGADQLAMRNPDDLGSPRAAALGALAPTAAPLRETPAAAPKPAPQAPAPTPIQVVSERAPRPYALRDGELVLPGGLIVHRVPRGVSVRTVQERQTGDQVWEIVDRRGRRLALLKEKSWRRAAVSDRSSLLAKTASSHGEGRRSDWGAAPVRVVIDQFQSETHTYTLERRALGTEWIWGGLELSARPPR